MAAPQMPDGPNMVTHRTPASCLPSIVLSVFALGLLTFHGQSLQYQF